MKNSIFKILAGLLAILFLAVGMFMFRMGELKFPLVALFWSIIFGAYAFIGKDFFSNKKVEGEGNKPLSAKQIRIKHLLILLIFIFLSFHFLPLIFPYNIHALTWWIYLALNLFFACYFYLFFLDIISHAWL